MRLYGLALVNGSLLCRQPGALLRFAYSDGATSISGKGEEVTKLPSQINHHWTEVARREPRWQQALCRHRLERSNIGERGLSLEEDRAVIWEVDPATKASRIYVSGIRNPTALAFEPTSNMLWAVVNERDELGAELVPDYLTSVKEGAFYGWPYSYWGQHVDPRVHPQKPDPLKARSRLDMGSASHVAPLGLSFASGTGLSRLRARRPLSANMAAGTASISRATR